MKTVDEIKRDAFPVLAAGTVVMIVKADYGWRVERWTPDGVAPQSEYDTPDEALARAAQIMGVSQPIVPQSWPEDVHVSAAQRKT